MKKKSTTSKVGKSISSGRAGMKKLQNQKPKKPTKKSSDPTGKYIKRLMEYDPNIKLLRDGEDFDAIIT